jgi:glycine/D-amino acid oxidase-like deaminating enzyme
VSERTALPPSLWAATAEPAPPTPPLAGEIGAEVAIVGGGFTGLSTALHLAEAGVATVLLEAGEPGWGASGRNGGQVMPGTKHSPDELADRLGAEAGARIAGFAEGVADFTFDLIERHRIPCHAERSGWIKAAHTPAALEQLKSYAAAQRRLGADIHVLDPGRLANLLGTVTDVYVGGLLDLRGGRLQPLSFARGLARAALDRGARIHGGSRAERIERSGTSWRVATARGAVRARQVLIATNAYTDDLCPALKRTMIPMSSVQVTTTPLEHFVRAAILPQGHVMSDTRRLLLYCRLDPEGRLVFGGRGALTDSGEAKCYAAVERAMRKMFPAIERIGVVYRWSGQVAVTPDALPRIIELAPNLVAALGYNGRGVAMATALGARIAAYFASGSIEHLPFPLGPLKPIPFHALRLPIVAAVTQYHRLRDAMRA